MPQRREQPYIWATWLPKLLTGELMRVGCLVQSPTKVGHDGRLTSTPSSGRSSTPPCSPRPGTGSWPAATKFSPRTRTRLGSRARPPCWPAGPIYSSSTARRPHHRRQDRPEPVPHRPAHDLHVRPAQGPAAVPRSQDPRRSVSIPTHPPSSAAAASTRASYAAWLPSSSASQLPKPPPTIASASECRFCDITADDCSDRVDADAAPATGDTDGLLTSSCSTSAVPVDSLSQSSCNIL